MPDDDDNDDYDVFLDNWVPGGLFEHATSSPYVHDPLVRQRVLEDSTGTADAVRTPNLSGYKSMGADERILRGFRFFKKRSADWSKQFRDQLVSAGLSTKNVDAFISAFARIWVDGRGRRQGSPEMLAIKAAIREHDQTFRADAAGKFVREQLPPGIQPLFSPDEMKEIFSVNERLLDALIPDYLDHLGSDGSESINHLYVRRGAYMPELPRVREELYCLSSYSLALEPTEMFAQTSPPSAKRSGYPCIFSAPLPAVQQRIVAFAPFIKGMGLRQLELVIAPPLESVPLEDLGVHGGIQEFKFE
jgi:hypothetical protein